MKVKFVIPRYVFHQIEKWVDASHNLPFGSICVLFPKSPSSPTLKICWSRQSPPSISLQEKPLAAIVSTSFWPWGDIRGTQPMESFIAHNSSKTFTVTKFSNRLLGVSWTHVRLMSLPWCHSFLAKYSKVFLLFWFCQLLPIIFYWLLSIARVQHFFFSLYVAWFILGPSQSYHCQKVYPTFACNIHFLITFNFRNYYSTLVSIVTICLFWLAFSVHSHSLLLHLSVIMITTFVKHLHSKHQHCKQALTNQVTTNYNHCRRLLVAGRAEALLLWSRGQQTLFANKILLEHNRA